MKKFFLILMMILGIWGAPHVSAQSLPSAALTHELLSYDLDAGEERLVIAPFLFQAFAIDRVEGVEVRYRQAGIWTDWSHLDYEEGKQVGSELVFLPSSDAFVLRSETDTRVKVTLMDLARSEMQVASFNPIGLSSSSSSSNVPFRIQSRSEWGANEDLRTYDPDDVEDDEDSTPYVNPCEPIETAYPAQYSLKSIVKYFDQKGRNLIWPQRYSKKVKKIVIHHTAQTLRDLNEDGQLNSRDYRLAVQAIYTYHTVSNGWGDLGYHYLVDPDGNVYEGRAGGKDVIGAHVLCQNSNTIGIAVMGNFVEEQLSRKAFEGLVNVTHHVSEEYNITPNGKSSFRGVVLPHIVTHADVGAVTKSHIGRGATQCPGDFLKSEMQELRQMVANGGFRPAVAYELLEKPRRIILDPLEEYELPLVFKNTGETMWSSVQVKSRKGKSLFFEDKSLLVAPGQTLALDLPLEASFKSGKTSLELLVTLNGQRMKTRIPLTYVVQKPKYRYEIVEVNMGHDSLLLGEERDVAVTLKNTSNFPWMSGGNYQVQLREIEENGAERIVLDEGLSVFLSKIVPVGEEVSFHFDVPVQQEEGAYSLQVAPVLGLQSGFRGRDILLRYSVEKPIFAADLRPKDRRYRANRGFTEDVEFQITNRGNFDWDAGTVWFEMQGIAGVEAEKLYISDKLTVGDSSSVFVPIRSSYDEKKIIVSGELGIDRLPTSLSGRRLSESSVSFERPFKTKGRTQLSAEYVSQSQELLPNSKGIYNEWVDLKNTGSVPWYRDGKDRIVLEVQQKGDFSHRSWEEKRSYAGFLEKEMVMPGEVGRFLMTLQVKGELRRTTYDDFMPFVNGKSLRVKKGNVSFGVEGRLPARPEKKELEEFGELEELGEEKMKMKELDEDLSESQGSRVESRELRVPPMRVLLTEIDQNVLDVSSPESFIVWDSKTVQIRNVREFSVSVSDVRDGTIFRMRAKEGEYLGFDNWDRIRAFGAGINDNTFRGVLEFRWDADEERMIVINELPLDEYMKGVAEVPETADQPQEKRKVIAVLARSYALHYLISGYEKFPGKPYNAADSPAIFQKYVGQNFEKRSPKWQRAIEETSGEVLLVQRAKGEGPRSKGDIVRAAYFSCTDGERTKSWDEVWPDNEYFQKFGEVFQSVLDPLGDDPNREGFIACGHQVGLSGYGATQKAAQGATYDEIIEYYYQGVIIGKY